MSIRPKNTQLNVAMKQLVYLNKIFKKKHVVIIHVPIYCPNANTMYRYIIKVLRYQYPLVQQPLVSFTTVVNKQIYVLAIWPVIRSAKVVLTGGGQPGCVVPPFG